MKTPGIVLMIFFISSVSKGYGQSSVDSAVMQFLRTVKKIPAPTLEIIKSNKKTLRSANFFIEPIDSLQNKNLKVKAFLFGSSVTHSRKYLLLTVSSKEVVENKIIDNKYLDSAITSLLHFMQERHLSDAEKSVLIRALTYVFN